ncbi:hypothetical protein [Hylemonella gracilis]|nr:hypothetical protein [Hylemonella gracilis]
MNSQPVSLKELQALYPYQFSKPADMDVAKGWMPIFAKLCADVDQTLGQDKLGFHWSQIKEKFGSARFYYRFGRRKSGTRLDIWTPQGVLSQEISPKRKVRTEKDRSFQDISRAILQLTDAAQVATKNVCLACGAPGSPDVGEGYVLMLCPEHQARRRQLDSQEGLIDWETLEDENNQGSA